MLEPDYKPPSLTRFHQSFTLFAGVVMPAISITLEATTHICAETFFDPIPSVWYLMLVIFVPIAQLHVWFTIRRGTTDRLVLTGWLNALSLGVSVFYSFMYIPLLPLAALTIAFIVGLLPLTRLLSLVLETAEQYRAADLTPVEKGTAEVTQRVLFAKIAASNWRTRWQQPPVRRLA